MKEVGLTFYSMTPWDKQLESLVQLLNRQSRFRPERWDITEPVRRVFSLESLESMEAVWQQSKGLLLKRKHFPSYWLSLEWWTDARHPGRLSIGIEEDFFTDQENTRAFLDFSKDLFIWGNMIYGFAAHQDEYEEQNVLPLPAMIEGKLISVGGTDIRRCLPGVYWANFFGEIYVQWFGESLVLNAPCYKREPLPGGGWLILTSPTPLEYRSEEVRKLELALRRHLGEDVFFDKKVPARPCRSPYRRSDKGG